MVGAVRQHNGRNDKTSFIIVDAQSVKNTDTAEEKGYDGGKLVSGIKRHIAVDTQGLPHAIHITTAKVTTGQEHWRRSACTKPRSLMSKTCWQMRATRVRNLPMPCGKSSGVPSKSPSAANSTPSPSSPNDGWWSVPSRGSKNAADSGKTANENLPQASTWPFSLSSSYSSKDYEQALRDRGPPR